MRFPTLNHEDFSDHQRSVANRIQQERVGGFEGPFVPLIYTPEVANRFQILDEYLRFGLRLPERLRALAVLIAAGRYRSSDVRHFVELEDIRNSGLEDHKIYALQEGRRPDSLTESQEIIYQYCNELVGRSSAKNATFDRAVKYFGREICMEFVVLCGHISLLTMFINITETSFSLRDV